MFVIIRDNIISKNIDRMKKWLKLDRYGHICFDKIAGTINSLYYGTGHDKVDDIVLAIYSKRISRRKYMIATKIVDGEHVISLVDTFFEKSLCLLNYNNSGLVSL